MRKFLTAILLLTASFVQAQRTIIYCGKLIDVTNSKVLSNYSIITEGNKIVDLKDYLMIAKYLLVNVCYPLSEKKLEPT